MLGLINSGTENWKYHNGITRGSILEGQVHLSSESDVLTFFEKGNFEKDDFVYTHDGLGVFFNKVVRSDKGHGGVLNLYIWQFLIDGKKPINLPGSQDDKIRVC